MYLTAGGITALDVDGNAPAPNDHECVTFAFGLDPSVPVLKNKMLSPVQIIFLEAAKSARAVLMSISINDVDVQVPLVIVNKTV